jgi:hypothetical protein
LNFEIRSVDASQGGNTGKVTVEIEGAKFQPTTVFFLEDGGTAIPASAIVFIDQTRVFATFDLRGQPTGMYDVVAERDDGQEATLPEGFEVVTGQSPQLSANIVQPSSVGTNRVSTFRVEFSNSGNVDIENPEIVLNSVVGAPVSLDVPGLDLNLTTMTLPLEEVGGPPGVLRPGAAGSIVVYTKSVTGLGFVLVMPALN